MVSSLRDAGAENHGKDKSHKLQDKHCVGDCRVSAKRWEVAEAMGVPQQQVTCGQCWHSGGSGWCFAWDVSVTDPKSFCTFWSPLHDGAKMEDGNG